MNYYNEQFKNGKDYENYIITEFKKLGINITLTKNFQEQIEIGETYEGYEIKYDKKYNETKNLWIETHERTDINKEYVVSGINREDNTIHYVIGDYERIFIFSKNVLKEVMKIHKIKENNMKTSKGFLLSELDAFKYANQIIESDELSNKQVGLDIW